MTDAHNIEKACVLAALAVLVLLLIALSLGACSTTDLEKVKRDNTAAYPQIKTREQQCREFGKYCEQEHD